MLVTALGATFAYRGVRTALETEFESRLERIVRRAASQIAPADIRDPAVRSTESASYTALQTLIGPLPATADLVDAVIVDSARVTLVDAREREEIEGLPSVLDSLARPAFDRAFAGHAAVSTPYLRDHSVRRAAVAPIGDEHGHALAVVAIEAEAAYLGALADLRHTLLLIALVSLLAITVLAALFIRVAASTARLERRLSRAENLAAMGRLTATLAHEIKNPLAVIRGSAERLGKLEPEARRMSDYVVEEADRLAKTVSRYLEFARGGVADGEAGDPIEALDQTLNLLDGEFRDRHVTVARSAVEAPAGRGSPRVALDRDSLKQVYLNLILNALEAMPDGGTLTVAAGEHAGKIEVALTDTGAGIPEETLRRIGSPFFTTKARGSGLGLFLTRRLVQSAGGELEIRSEVGRGTTCVVRWPRRKGGAAK
ncbi:MAG TPA: ATP-binding protein [Candidatus Udaeobacter sp.]|nr:ATP-binding protein [Candidatus Udaeobacter sp.]